MFLCVLKIGIGIKLTTAEAKEMLGIDPLPNMVVK